MGLATPVCEVQKKDVIRVHDASAYAGMWMRVDNIEVDQFGRTHLSCTMLPKVELVIPFNGRVEKQ